MAYPPTVPPNSRANGTATFDNHASDHNAVADALTDIIAELGSNPSGGFADVQTLLAALVPPGTIAAYGGSSAPSGYLLCDGSGRSRTNYAALFAVIGTTFGSGDGSTTFNLPNLKGRFPIGRDSGEAAWNTVGETGGSADAVAVQHTHVVDSHTHSLNGHVHAMPHVHATVADTSLNIQGITGAVNSFQPKTDATTEGYTPLENQSTGAASNANTQGPSTTNTGSKSPGTDNGNASGGTVAGTNKNLPPYLTLNYIIKT